MTEYPSNWKQITELVKKRDHYTCQECGKTYPPFSPYLHVHHKVELSKGGTNDPSNLISLCTFCHTQKHTHLQKRYGVYKEKLKCKPLKR